MCASRLSVLGHLALREMRTAFASSVTRPAAGYAHQPVTTKRLLSQGNQKSDAGPKEGECHEEAAKQKFPPAKPKMVDKKSPQDQDSVPTEKHKKDVYITALSEMDKLEESIQGLFQRTLTFGMEVADHLERAILSVDKDKLSKERVKSLSSFYDNLKHIDEEMEKVFAKNGLKRTHPLGELFDPEYHEVDFEVEGDKADVPGKIAVVVSSGYVFNGKPIRPAKVGVFKPKSK